jgi:hypothetical protein
MGIRNCRDVGENLQKIVSRLMANDRLVNLLYYTGKDPYNETPLTQEEKKKLVYEKLIKVVPRVGPKETATSIVVIRVARARTNQSNGEFKDLIIEIEIFVPLTQWMIKDSNLRPFAIMGEIQESLNGKTINGLGKMTGGDFDLNFLSDEISCYIQSFNLTSYE